MDEIKTDATAALSGVKAEIDKLEGDAKTFEVKAEKFWSDRRLYIVCSIIAVICLIIGHKVQMP